MMNKIISISQKKFNIDEIKQTIPNNYLIVFYAPINSIDTVGKTISEHYSNSIGCSSYKNITKTDCSVDIISILGIETEDVKFCLLPDISTKFISYYEEINALKSIYKKDHSILLEFTDGLSLAEESILTVISNELPNIPLIGGSAGDNGDFSETRVCVNGKSMTNATALCMLTTKMFIDTYIENIYEPTDIKAIITKSDLFKREVHTINNTPALDFYCNALNVSENQIRDEFISHPLARIIGDHYFISSIKDTTGKSICAYTRNFQQSYISICNPIDYLSLWNNTINKNNSTNTYCGGIFVNCIFRTILFEKDNTINDFQNYLNSYGDFICMTSYGEQYLDSHCNQTLTACLFREN